MSAQPGQASLPRGPAPFSGASTVPPPVPKSKSPVFAVFPFNPPDVFSYQVPDLSRADPEMLKVVKYLQEASSQPVTRARRTVRKKAAKPSASAKKAKHGGK